MTRANWARRLYLILAGKDPHPLWHRIDGWHRDHLRQMYKLQTELHGLKDSFETWLSTSPQNSLDNWMKWFLRYYQEWYAYETADDEGKKEMHDELKRSQQDIDKVKKRVTKQIKGKGTRKIASGFTHSDQLDLADACKAVLPKNADGDVSRYGDLLRVSVLPRHSEKVTKAASKLGLKLKHGPYTYKEAKKNGFTMDSARPKDPNVFMWFETDRSYVRG